MIIYTHTCEKNTYNSKSNTIDCHSIPSYQREVTFNLLLKRFTPFIHLVGSKCIQHLIFFIKLLDQNKFNAWETVSLTWNVICIYTLVWMSKIAYLMNKNGIKKCTNKLVNFNCASWWKKEFLHKKNTCLNRIDRCRIH